MANGDRVSSPGCAVGLTVRIAGEAFNVDLYGLALGSYNVVLDVQWLESLGPILRDFGRWTMAFVRNGARMLWTIVDTVALPPVLHSVALELLDDLLAAYQAVVRR